jgi:hypothetical protein
MSRNEDTTRRLCDAQRRAKEGGRCTRPAGWGTSHAGIGRCKLHGGSTPNHGIAAARATLSHIATRIDAANVMPDEALRLCVRIAAGEVLYASQRVAALAEETADAKGRLHPWIVVRQQAVDLLARVSKMAIDAGILEREADAARLSGDQITGALRASLSGLSLTAEQEHRLRTNIDEQLRLLERS